MEPCTGCGYAYDTDVAALLARLASFGARFADTLRGRDDAVLRTRPHPETWSALEYTCHVRDVLLVQRERLYTALVEERPETRPMYRDARPALARYNDQDPAIVVTHLAMAADLAAQAFGALDATHFQRRLVYTYPEPLERTVLWLGQNTIHEAHHHLVDVQAVLAAVAG